MGYDNMNKQKVLYILKCGHVGMGVPGLARMLLCHEHEWQDITGVHVTEWRVMCKTCRYARWCGLARVQALFLGTAHKRDHPDHVVGDEYVINSNAVAEQRRLEKNHLLPES
jgi:hypothetical protein